MTRRVDEGEGLSPEEVERARQTLRSLGVGEEEMDKALQRAREEGTPGDAEDLVEVVMREWLGW